MSFPSTLSASSLRHFSLTPLSSLGCQGLSLNSLSPTSSFPRLLDAKISKKLRRLPTTNPSTKTSIIATTHPQPQVSIPQWCDCCCHWSHRLRSALLVSIPQWCDCCSFTASKCNPTTSVSIPQWCDCCTSVLKLTATFSHKVSIPQWCDCCPLWFNRNMRQQ